MREPLQRKGGLSYTRTARLSLGYRGRTSLSCSFPQKARSVANLQCDQMRLLISLGKSAFGIPIALAVYALLRVDPVLADTARREQTIASTLFVATSPCRACPGSSESPLPKMRGTVPPHFHVSSGPGACKSAFRSHWLCTLCCALILFSLTQPGGSRRYCLRTLCAFPSPCRACPPHVAVWCRSLGAPNTPCV